MVNPKDAGMSINLGKPGPLEDEFILHFFESGHS